MLCCIDCKNKHSLKKVVESKFEYLDYTGNQSEYVSWVVVGSNTCAGIEFFLQKKFHKSFFYDHHVMGFVHYLSVRCTMYQLYHVYRWQRWQICPNSNKELFEQLKM